MYKKLHRCLVTLVFLLSSPVHAWNEVGHKVIVHSAYQQLTPRAKAYVNQLNQELDAVYGPLSLVEAGPWLDSIHYARGVRWYDAMHYVNQYFSTDGSPLPSAQKINAVWAINMALETLHNKRSYPFDKGVALRVLIHVVGDLHQPLHGSTLVSQAFPKGDRGGNLFLLGSNPVAKNLHSYWDRGGGLLVEPYEKIVEQLPVCDPSSFNLDPETWLDESYLISRNKAYTLNYKESPTKDYQETAKIVSSQRLALAGCRLAALLNQL